MSRESAITLEEKPAYFSQFPFLVEQDAAKIQAPLVHTHSPYHSKLYTSAVSVNPLIAAASPILSLLGRLQTSPHPADIAELYLDLIHEIKSFESYAQRLSYRTETIFIARYMLAATIDETILNTSWGQESGWENHKILFFFQQEEWGGERFFVILERLQEEPLLYIDALELAYMCLSLGYEGKFRYQERGHLALDEIIKKLFFKISQVRDELKPDLNSPKLATLPKSQTVKVLIPTKLFCLSTLFSLLIMGSAFTGQQWQQLNPLHYFFSTAA